MGVQEGAHVEWSRVARWELAVPAGALLLSCREGGSVLVLRVAVRHLAAVQPALEPCGTLRGSSMGEGFGADVTLSHFLQAVVTNGRRSGQALTDVAVLNALFPRVAPDARVTV